MISFFADTCWQDTAAWNKVITTMVIRPLDDRAYCVRSAFTHFVLGESCKIVQGINSEPGNVLSNNCPQYHPPSSLGVWKTRRSGIDPARSIARPGVLLGLYWNLYLLPFLSYLAGSKSVSVRHGHDENVPPCPFRWLRETAKVQQCCECEFQIHLPFHKGTDQVNDWIWVREIERSLLWRNKLNKVVIKEN